MTESFLHVNGERLTRLRLHVPNVGPWTAQLDFEGDPVLTGKVTLHVGELELAGTMSPSQTGRFGLQTLSRIDAGGGGWAKTLKPKHYHNDGGVKARDVATDAARDAGEQLGDFTPAAERIGVDYVREEMPASSILEGVIGHGVPWWVDYAGVTHVGPRPATELSPDAYQLLAFDPRTRWATLGVDDPRAVKIGSIITERLEVPGTVRELELTVTSEEMRIAAWLGRDDAQGGRLAEILRSIVTRLTDGKLFGPFRYRLVQMADKRVKLQAVRAAAGLPDILPVSMWPGIAGVHAELTPGAEVLVEFIEGDRTMPVVTHFAGADGKGFVPVSLVLGGTSGEPVARLGDTVEVLLPPAAISGTLSGAPFTGVVTFPLSKTLGTITAGSSIVKAAT